MRDGETGLVSETEDTVTSRKTAGAVLSSEHKRKRCEVILG